MGHIHSGTRLTARYERVLALLRSRGEQGATSWEIVSLARVAALTATVSELRRYGREHAQPAFEIECDRVGKTADGATIFRYRLIEHGQQRELFSSTGGI